MATGRGGSTSDQSDDAGPSSGLPARRGRTDVTAPIRRKPRRPLPEFTGLPAPRDETIGGFHDFLPDALRIVHTRPSRAIRIVGYGLCAIVLAAIAWSVFGHLRLFAIASGELEARGGNQVIEPLQVGQVSAIPVKTGSHVEKNDVVLQLDPTVAQAAKSIIDAKLANARAESLRRSVAASAAGVSKIDADAKIPWPSDTAADVRSRQDGVLRADLSKLGATLADLQAKLRIQEAARDKFVANIDVQKTLIESRTKRMAMHETLAQQGWDSRATVLQALEPLRQDQVSLTNMQGSLEEAKAAIPVVTAEIAEARAGFIAENIDAAAAAERQVAGLIQELKQADLAIANLSLRAPVSGVVHALAVTNVGQSVAVGEKLMQIVPDGAALDIRAYVLNADIGFIKAGQPVTIKVDTFPYTRYGTIEGRVAQVGADAVTGRYALAQQNDSATTPKKGELSVTKPGQQTADLVFPVTVIPTKFSIDVEGRDVPLTAGMSVVVEIETQRQRAISYILTPLTRVFESGKPSS